MGRHGQDRFQCVLCKDFLGSYEVLFVHMKNAHDSGVYCSWCQHEVETCQDFFVHVRDSHHSGLKYNCPRCGVRFAREADMVNHKEEIHAVAEGRDEGDNKHEKEEAAGAEACSICGFKSQAVKPRVRRDIIARHMTRVHTIGKHSIGSSGCAEDAVEPGKRGVQTAMSGGPEKRRRGA